MQLTKYKTNILARKARIRVIKKRAIRKAGLSYEGLNTANDEVLNIFYKKALELLKIP